MNTTDTTQAVQLQMVDAREVLIDANIRTNTKIDRPFVASIKRHGVIIPVLAHPAEDGRVWIEDGQRRILAAVEAERHEVPAYIVPEGDTEAMRIVRQLIANEHRAELDESERVAAWRQLELDGMSVTAIARAVGEKPKRVKAGLAVAASEAATKEVTEHQVTLDQALVIAEFEDDPDTAERLRDTAQHSPSQFEHQAQRARDMREERAAIEELIAHYTEQGYQQIDWPHWEDRTTLPFRDLTQKDGTAITEENYLGGDGHRYAIREAWNGIEVGHFVTDWRKWGLKKRKPDGSVNMPWTEEQKQERRTLIANNKAWKSAETVRREWLRTFLSRKATPKGAQQFIAASVIDGRGRLTSSIGEHHRLALDLLGLPDYSWSKTHPILAHTQKQPGRTMTALLAVTIAAHEEATGTHTWRNPSEDMADYFTALAEWGYSLSDVENLVLGIEPPVEDTPEHADDPETAGTEDTGTEEASDDEADTDADADADPEGEVEEPAQAEPEAQDEEPSENEDTAEAQDADCEAEAEAEAVTV